MVEEAIVSVARLKSKHLKLHAADELKHLLQIDLEAYGHEIDFEKLEGLWRLIYTTALDVVGGMVHNAAKVVRLATKVFVCRLHLLCHPTLLHLYEWAMSISVLGHWSLASARTSSKPACRSSLKKACARMLPTNLAMCTTFC